MTIVPVLYPANQQPSHFREALATNRGAVFYEEPSGKFDLIPAK